MGQHLRSIRIPVLRRHILPQFGNISQVKADLISIRVRLRRPLIRFRFYSFIEYMLCKRRKTEREVLFNTSLMYWRRSFNVWMYLMVFRKKWLLILQFISYNFSIIPLSSYTVYLVRNLFDKSYFLAKGNYLNIVDFFCSEKWD